MSIKRRRTSDALGLKTSRLSMSQARDDFHLLLERARKQRACKRAGQLGRVNCNRLRVHVCARTDRESESKSENKLTFSSRNNNDHCLEATRREKTLLLMMGAREKEKEKEREKEKVVAGELAAAGQVHGLRKQPAAAGHSASKTSLFLLLLVSNSKSSHTLNR